MSAPTLTSLARLRKMVGFLRVVGDIGLHLQFPQDGHGRLNAGGECRWILESFSDADMWGTFHQWMFHVCKQQKPECHIT
jgi:hypothetical protein